MKRAKSILAITISLVVLIASIPLMPVSAIAYNITGGQVENYETDASFFSYIISDGEVIIGNYIGSDTAVVIPSTIEGCRVTTIGGWAFSHCDSLTSLEIPNGVTKIGSNAFTDCSSLQSVTLPDTVTEIKSEAFYGCSNLNTITVPENLVKLGKKVFAGNYSGQCRSLSKVIPSKNVKTFKNSSLELVWNQICKELKPFSEVIARILTFW